jgi:type I restriction enzyme S subunit
MTKNTSDNTKELPTGWEWKKLGEIVKTIDGDRGSNYPKQNDYLQEGYCLFLSTKNVREFGFKFDENVFISEEKDILLRSGRLEINDVIITTRGTLGNIAVFDETIKYKIVRINSGMLILRTNIQKLDKYFLANFFTSPLFKEQLYSKQTGSAQPQIPAGVLKEILIPLPPLKEQERIVQKLDTAFQSLDEAITLQKENIAHTQELKKAVLVEQISNLACEMKDILEGVTMSNKSVIPKNDETYNYVGLENIQKDTGQLVDFEPQIGSEIKSNKVFFKKGMVLYGKLRPYLNKVYVAEFDGIATTEILPFLCKSHLNPYFLAYYLRSDDFVNIVSECTQGSRMPRLRTEFWKNEAQIPLPPLPEQERIVAYLDTSFAKLDTLIVEQEARLAQLMELKKSVLQEAFEGKL